MVDQVERYALRVNSGEEVAGPLVRRACKRHIDDREHGEKRDLWWDREASERVIRYFRAVLRLSGGKFEGEEFRLQPAQAFIIGSIYGWQNNRTKCRRFNTAYVETSKGSGKTPLAAGIGLYMVSADGEPRAEVYVAAVDRDQARITFRDAVAMVDQSPALDGCMMRSGGKDGDVTKVWNLAHLNSGSFFRPIASESRGRGKSGFRPYCVILDELHEHPTDSMVEFTRKNIKGRENSLVFMITNAGVYDVTSVCWRYHTYSAKVVSREVEDDEFFAFVCSLDPGDSWTDPKVWKKVSPLLGVTPPKSYLEKEVREAIGMPSKQSLTRRLNFCEWMESVSPFVAQEVWTENGGTFNESDLAGKPCFGGLDLSGKNDLTCLELIFELEEGVKAVLSFFWTPEDTIRQREERDNAPYRQWVRDGFLMTTPGKTIHYGWVAQKLAELSTKYQIEAIAFDRWRIDDLVRELDDIGADVVLKEHGQGFKDMSPAIEALEDELLERRLRHQNHPVLTSCVNNAKVVDDPAGLRKFDKRKATGRIDGAVALAMACGLAESGDENGSIYETRGILAL